MRRIFLSCFLLAAMFTTLNFASAQQFQPAVYYTASVSNGLIWPVVATDFNNDGILDLAVGANATSRISVLLGNGAGTFRSGGSLFTSGLIWMAAGDLNGDGKADLVVTNFAESGRVFVYFGNGDGTFVPSASYRASFEPIGIVIADFTGDGHPDVAVANANENGPNGEVLVYPNLGNGTLGTAAKYVLPGHPWSLAAGDLNGDGKLDLAVTKNNTSGANFKNTLSILLNNGDGTFINNVTYSVGIEGTSIALADLNHDGKLDLAATYDQEVLVMLGIGDGTFGGGNTYSTTTLGQGASSIVIADFNLDGNPDLAMELANGDPLANTGLLYGIGDGTFQSPPLAVDQFVNGGNSIVAGDFNHDGAPDLAFGIWAKGKVAVMLNAQ